MTEKMNNEQREAIEYPYSGPILVLAGAGTGKTTVLTKRIEFLINKLNYNPENILAITFTNKAGNEIKKRLLLIGQDLPWVGTFHSICMKILRYEIGKANRESNFKIIDSDDINKLIKNIMVDIDLNTNDFPVKDVISYLEKFKRTNLVFGFKHTQVEEFCQKYQNKDPRLLYYLDKIIKIFQIYEEKMQQLNYLDFNDLLNYTAYILMNYEQSRNYWSSKFEYILIDEFQDTNDIQYQLLMLLKNQDSNIFAVGDGDQTIYSFRGANPEIINKFVELIPDKKVIVLKQNYRSTQNILNASNSLINYNKNRIKKTLLSNNGDGEKPTLYVASSDLNEAFWVCQQIIKLKKDGVNLREIAILLRSNYLTRVFEQELTIKNISYKIFGGIKFYQRAEIKDLISYLNVINNYDELSLMRILNVPNRKIGLTTEETILEYSKINNISFFDTLTICDKLPINSLAKKSIKEFLNLIEELKQHRDGSIKDLLDLVIEKTNYISYCEKKDNERKEIIHENINELKNAIINFENSNIGSTLDDYLQNISLFTDKENDDSNNNLIEYVSLMTVHNSKGLEFDYVFLSCFNDGIFPSNISIKDGEIEEERRVAYVALTRARKKLFLTYNTGMDFITKTSRCESRFISEIGYNNLNYIRTKSIKINDSSKDFWFDSHEKKEINLKDMLNNNLKITDFKIGDEIVHSIYGNGTILNIINDRLIIKFKIKKFGEKELLFNHKNIKRIFK